MQCFAPGTLFATCDDAMKVYFDGVIQFQDNNWSGMSQQWQATKELMIPTATKVLGIECADFGGNNGILASSADGLVTDGSWLCSTNQNLEGWAQPGFVDTGGDFSAASTSASNLGPSAVADRFIYEIFVKKS